MAYQINLKVGIFKIRIIMLINNFRCYKNNAKDE